MRLGQALEILGGSSSFPCSVGRRPCLRHAAASGSPANPGRHLRGVWWSIHAMPKYEPNDAAGQGISREIVVQDHARRPGEPVNASGWRAGLVEALLMSAAGTTRKQL